MTDSLGVTSCKPCPKRTFRYSFFTWFHAQRNLKQSQQLRLMKIMSTLFAVRNMLPLFVFHQFPANVPFLHPMEILENRMV